MKNLLLRARLFMINPFLNLQGGGDETEVVEQGKSWIITALKIVIAVIAVGIGVVLIITFKDTITEQITKLKNYVNQLLSLS